MTGHDAHVPGDGADTKAPEGTGSASSHCVVGRQAGPRRSGLGTAMRDLAVSAGQASLPSLRRVAAVP